MADGALGRVGCEPQTPTPWAVRARPEAKKVLTLSYDEAGRVGEVVWAFARNVRLEVKGRECKGRFGR